MFALLQNAAFFRQVSKHLIRGPSLARETGPRHSFPKRHSVNLPSAASLPYTTSSCESTFDKANKHLINYLHLEGLFSSACQITQGIEEHGIAQAGKVQLHEIGGAGLMTLPSRLQLDFNWAWISTSSTNWDDWSLNANISGPKEPYIHNWRRQLYTRKRRVVSELKPAIN